MGATLGLSEFEIAPVGDGMEKDGELPDPEPGPEGGDSFPVGNPPGFCFQDSASGPQVVEDGFQEPCPGFQVLAVCGGVPGLPV